MQYHKELQNGFQKCGSNRSGRFMSDKCDFPARAIEKHKVTGVETDEDDNIQWVDSCEKESW